MTEPELLRILVTALGGNPDSPHYTMEHALKQIEYNRKHYSLAQLKAAEKDQYNKDVVRIRALVVELKRRNEDYGRLAGKYQRLFRAHRELNRLNSALMREIAAPFNNGDPFNPDDNGEI